MKPNHIFKESNLPKTNMIVFHQALEKNGDKKTFPFELIIFLVLFALISVCLLFMSTNSGLNHLRAYVQCEKFKDYPDEANIWMLSQGTLDTLQNVTSVHSRNVPFLKENIQCNTVSIANRFDCYPAPDVSEEKCVARGCCWKPALPSSKQSNTYVNTPYCYYPNGYQSHRRTNITYNKFGVSVWYTRSLPSGYPKDSNNIRMDIGCFNNERIQINIFDERKQHFRKGNHTMGLN